MEGGFLLLWASHGKLTMLPRFAEDIIKTYDQEMLHDPSIGHHGDCFRAAIRTLAQRDLELLPHPIDLSNGNWNVEFFDVLRETHVALGLISGRSPRNNGTNHIAVYDFMQNHIIHDPHPSRAGILTRDWRKSKHEPSPHLFSWVHVFGREVSL